MIEIPCFALVGTLDGEQIPVDPTVDIFTDERAAERHADARNGGECYGGAHYVVESAKVLICNGEG